MDVRLPDGNGIDVLRSLRDNDDPTPAVMISGHGTIRDAVEATRSGAFDFLEKPLARDRSAQVLGQTGGNVSGAARLLGIERMNLHKRIRALGLSREK